MSVEWSDQIVIADLADEPALSDELASLLERLDAAESYPNVVLNFQHVSYVNSSNLAQLLKLRKLLVSHDRAVRLCSVAPDVMSVLRITGLDKLFSIAPDPLTALAGFQIQDGG